jgi:hypothetical protein
MLRLSALIQSVFVVAAVLRGVTSLAGAEPAKSQVPASIAKKIDAEFAAYQKAVDSLHAAEQVRLKKYASVLQDIKAGSWSLEDRNQGTLRVESMILRLGQGMKALRAVENGLEAAGSPANAIGGDASPTVEPTQRNTVPPGKYTIKACAAEGARVLINGKNVFKETGKDAVGFAPSVVEYEVTGPIQITVESWCIVGDRDNGFAFSMVDTTGKEVIGTKSGWKSYQVNYFEDWFMDKEIRNLGRVLEKRRPSSLGVPYIYDARPSGAALCFLIWGR